MKINSSFSVDTPPDQRFAYLLDVNKVVVCVPGAEVGEVVDAPTFRGKLKAKVGAVPVTYQGTPHIVDRGARGPGHREKSIPRAGRWADRARCGQGGHDRGADQ